MTPEADGGGGQLAESNDEWWDETWEKLQLAFKTRFGETEPAEKVFPFHGALSLAFPGLCVLPYGPTEQRPTWLYSTMGVSPPPKQGATGIGSEFSVETKESAEWPLQILGWTVNGLISGDRVSAGSYVSCTIAKRQDGSFVLSGPDPERNKKAGLTPQGTVAGMLVFPSLAAKGPLETRFGPVAILALTFVPKGDLKLAEETSTSHVVLLARELGLGQRSDIARTDLISMPEASARWSRISKLNQQEVLSELGIEGEYPYALLTHK